MGFTPQARIERRPGQREMAFRVFGCRANQRLDRLVGFKWRRLRTEQAEIGIAQVGMGCGHPGFLDKLSRTPRATIFGYELRQQAGRRDQGRIKFVGFARLRIGIRRLARAPGGAGALCEQDRLLPTHLRR